MSSTVIFEDILVFLVLSAGVFMYGRAMIESQVMKSKIDSPKVVLKFRCVSILLLGYFMLIGVIYQLGFLNKTVAVPLFVVGLVPALLGLRWLRRQLNQALATSPMSVNVSDAAQQDVGGGSTDD